MLKFNISDDTRNIFCFYKVNSNNTILNEMRGLKEETGRQLRDNTRALKDVKSELVNLCEDMMRQLKTLVSTLRASKVRFPFKGNLALKSNSFCNRMK